MKIKIVMLLCLLGLSSSVFALEAFEGKVTVVEPSYLPGGVAFKMATGNTTCPAGTWLWWKNANSDNTKGVYSTLMTAVVSGKSVRFHFADGDTTCVGLHLHLLDY